MKIEIIGTPGTGNTFQEFNIGTVSQWNPAATVINNYYGERESDAPPPVTNKEAGVPSKGTPTFDQAYIEAVSQDILNYVGCIRQFLDERWKQNYNDVWTGILGLDKVRSRVFEIGKQKGTNFNRNLVANIIHYLDSKGFYQEAYNAAVMTRHLENNPEHSVRLALGCDPSDEVRHEIDRFINNFSL